MLSNNDTISAPRPEGSPVGAAALQTRPGDSPGAGAREGEIDLERWVDDHGDFLLRSATRLVGSLSVAEDLVQEAFLIAHRRRQQLHEGETERAWLYRVVRNLVRHHRRAIARRLKLQRAVTDQAPSFSATGDTPHDHLVRSERVRGVRSCVAKLPLKQREVFVLYELEGLSGAEIAGLLEIPENTVWSRLRHARYRFRAHWERLARREGPA